MHLPISVQLNPMLLSLTLCMLIPQMGETLSAITCACGLHVCDSRQMMHARMLLSVSACGCIAYTLYGGACHCCSRCMCVGVMESVITPIRSP